MKKHIIMMSCLLAASLAVAKLQKKSVIDQKQNLGETTQFQNGKEYPSKQQETKARRYSLSEDISFGNQEDQSFQPHELYHVQQRPASQKSVKQ